MLSDKELLVIAPKGRSILTVHANTHNLLLVEQSAIKHVRSKIRRPLDKGLLLLKKSIIVIRGTILRGLIVNES